MTDTARAQYRVERWALWIHRQNDLSRGVTCSLLGALLGESMEAYRQGGDQQLSKPFACLIHGKGHPKPENQEDDAAEWEVQGIIDQMPRFLREIKKVLYTEFLMTGSQESKARRLKMPLLTYKSHMSRALLWVANHLSREHE